MKTLISIMLLAATSALADPPKVAIIGLRHPHAWEHLGEIIKSPDIRLVGVAENIPEVVARAKAKDFGVPDNLFFDDYEAMLDKVKPDFVWAFVENNRHLEITLACAKRGLPVMFEKPLSATYQEALDIRAAARKSGIIVVTNYQMAWWPTNIMARKIAERGDLGDVYRVRGVVGHGGPRPGGPASKVSFDWITDPVKDGGGALADFGCYNAIWSLSYLGRPKTVYAQAGHLQPDRYPKVEDYALIVLGYPGAYASLEASWDLPRSFQDLEVFGRKGSVMMTEDSLNVQQSGKKETTITPDPLPPEESSPIACMINVVKTHKEPSGITGLDINVQVMEIMDAAKESIRTGQAVTLPATPK